MKRPLSLALAAAVGLSLLAGCAPEAPAPSDASDPAGSPSSSVSSQPEEKPQLEVAPSSGEMKLTEFKNIQLSTLSPDIRIERGEDWGIRYTLHNKEKVTRAEVKDDTLYFSSTFKLTPTVDLKDCELVIIIPVGQELQDVSLATAAGTIELFNLNCRYLDLESVSGDVKLDHVVSKTLEAESTSGHVTATACTADKAEAESTSGSVKLDGTYQTADLSSVSGSCELYAQIGKEAEIETVSGNITAQAPARKLEVRSIGSITINGEKHGGRSVTMGEGEPSLSIESVSGTVTVDQNALVMIS